MTHSFFHLLRKDEEAFFGIFQVCQWVIKYVDMSSKWG